METPTFAELVAAFEQVRRAAADAQWTGREDKETYWTAVKQLLTKMSQVISTS